MSEPRLSLLLVDDHRMLRESLRRSLEASGLHVIAEAGDGEEALRLARDLQPTVVLMDVSMPGMGGVEATRLLRAQVPASRVVMLTMHADDDVLARALRAGADGYLVKDCSIDEVVAMVIAVAAGDTVVSADLAASMLHQVRMSTAPAAQDVVTKREEEVLQLIADGCATAEVAERLFISQKTVKNHLASIYQKLDARDRTQAVLRAVRMGIIRLE